MEEPRNQDENLDDQSRTQEDQRDSREAVFSQEGHQEPNTKEDHDVDILEHWKYYIFRRLADRLFNLTRISVSYLGTSSFHTVGTFLCSFRVISVTFGFISN